jgi:hypothetical protein
MECPKAMGLIDGVFETKPSVWHKEILWALSRGIWIFGAASIGALRAVELAPFGMIGVGRVFRWFRDGILEDDDEVAVQHGPAETSYALLSLAMVNVRASLEAARAAETINSAEVAVLSACAKALFYKDRNWESIIEASIQAGIESTSVTRLNAWLHDNEVDVKRQDACELLHFMLAWNVQPGVQRSEQQFPSTIYWEQLHTRLSRLGTSGK